MPRPALSDLKQIPASFCSDRPKATSVTLPAWLMIDLHVHSTCSDGSEDSRGKSSSWPQPQAALRWR